MDSQPQSSPALLAAGLLVSLLAIGGMAYTGLQLGFVPGMQDSLSAAVSRTAPLKVLSPNGGEVWTASTTQNITWSGGADSWKMSLLIMNEARTKTVKTITSSTVNTGTYPWLVTSDIPAGNYYLRIACQNCKSNVQNRTDFSDAPFTIASSSELVIAAGAPDPAPTTEDTNGDVAGGQEGVYTIKFDVTATNDAIYIPFGATTATSSVDTDDGIAYVIRNSNGVQIALNGLGRASTTAAVSSTADVSGAYYVINEGETESFTLTVTLVPTEDGFFRAQLYGINFNASSAAAANMLQIAMPTTDFETGFLNINI